MSLPRYGQLTKTECNVLHLWFFKALSSFDRYVIQFIKRFDIQSVPVTVSKITAAIFFGVVYPKGKVKTRTIAADSHPIPSVININEFWVTMALVVTAI